MRRMSMCWRRGSTTTLSVSASARSEALAMIGGDPACQKLRAAYGTGGASTGSTGLGGGPRSAEVFGQLKCALSEVSVIIPAFNEAENLQELHHQLTTRPEGAVVRARLRRRRKHRREFRASESAARPGSPRQGRPSRAQLRPARRPWWRGWITRRGKSSSALMPTCSSIHATSPGWWQPCRKATTS